MRVVLDTNVLVSGLLWGGPPNRLLCWARDGVLQALCCENVLIEVRRVLAYPRMQRRLADLGTSEAAALACLMNALTHAAPPLEKPSVITADPSDNPFLGLAQESGARLLVSGDQHLLTVGQFRGISVVTAAEAVDVVRRLAHNV